MMYAGSQTIKACKEYDEISIPIHDLLGDDGRLNIYPEISGKGYFDIDYKNGVLSLKATKYIGLIPISDEFAIHVEPRAPIANLMWMIGRVGMPLAGLDKFVFIRGYQEQMGVVDNPEEVYVSAFDTALQRTSKIGVLKRYVKRISENELRGRLLMNMTIGQFRSRGISHRAAFEMYDLTENNPENQIIKHTAERLLRYFTTRPTSETRKFADHLKALLRPFSMVDSSQVNDDFVARNVPRLIRALPRSHRFYESVLWLSYLISTNSGITMEKVGQARFDTVILDAATVFERYVRRVIQDSVGQLGNCSVLDGNEIPVPLFTDSGDATTKPDYYFLRDSKRIAVADAKYKPRNKITAPDRYELLAFCEALSVSKAAFIVPAYEGQPLSEHHGTTAAGRCIAFVGINLAANDIEAEESGFIQRLNTALGLA